MDEQLCVEDECRRIRSGSDPMECPADQVSIILCRMFANVQSIQTALKLIGHKSFPSWSDVVVRQFLLQDLLCRFTLC